MPWHDILPPCGREYSLILERRRLAEPLLRRLEIVAEHAHVGHPTIRPPVRRRVWRRIGNCEGRACPMEPPSGRLLARIEDVEAVASRPLIVTGDNAITYGVSLGLGFSPSLPGGGLRRKWPNPLPALLGEMKVILWVNSHLTA